MGPVDWLGREHWLERTRVSGAGDLEQGLWLRARLLTFESSLDDLEREEILPLLAEDPPEPVHVVVVELAIARWRPFGDQQAAALEKANLGDRDVREFLPQEREDVAN
jgi:hypothetical protein